MRQGRVVLDVTLKGRSGKVGQGWACRKGRGRGIMASSVGMRQGCVVCCRVGCGIAGEGRARQSVYRRKQKIREYCGRVWGCEAGLCCISLGWMVAGRPGRDRVRRPGCGGQDAALMHTKDVFVSILYELIFLSTLQVWG